MHYTQAYRKQIAQLEDIIGALVVHLEDECGVSLDDVLGGEDHAIAEHAAEEHRQEWGGHSDSDDGDRDDALREDAWEARRDAAREEAL